MSSPVRSRPNNPVRNVALGIALAGIIIGAALTGSGVASAAFSESKSVAHTASSRSCFFRTTVQSGTATSTVNGTTTVTISAVDTSKAFLMFTTRSNSNRPPGSEVKGRVASATTVEFDRQTNESPVGTITIDWDVIEYSCGVKVQRGATVPSGTTTNVTITAVNSLAAAFVTYSKTPGSGTNTWSGNDPAVAELTTTTNLQFRSDVLDGSDVIWWQVIEFTDPTGVNVRTGTTTMAAGSASRVIGLSPFVDTTKTFVLASTRNNSPGNDVGSGMLTAQVSPSLLVFARAASAYDVTEIHWQLIELKDGSRVQQGVGTFAAGTGSITATLTALNPARTTAFASTQVGAGQSCGRTSYTTDDIIGDACATVDVASSTGLTLTRGSTLGTANLNWFAVSWGTP